MLTVILEIGTIWGGINKFKPNFIPKNWYELKKAFEQSQVKMFRIAYPLYLYLFINNQMDFWKIIVIFFSTEYSVKIGKMVAKALKRFLDK